MKKRVIAVLISAILLYQPLSVSAAAAPDGMTDASKTPAAQNGAWDAWCEEWETIKTDWTQVAMSPGSDETRNVILHGIRKKGKKRPLYMDRLRI